MRIRFAFLLCLIVPSAANADCPADTDSIVQCTILGAKELSVCLSAEDHLLYSFGPPGAPELEMERRFDEVEMRPWKGWGRDIRYSVDFHNAGYSYHVYWHYDRQAQISDSGILVAQGEEIGAEFDAHVFCQPDGGEFAFDLLEERMRAAGYCRNSTVETLHYGGCE